MTLTVIGFNIHAQALSGSQRDATVDYLRALRPLTCVVMDDLAFALILKRALPDMHVIYRMSNDDNLHMRMSAVDFVQRHAHLRDTGLIAYANNEPGFISSTAWHVEVMHRALETGLKVCVGNYSVGTPEPDDLPRARQMLELLAARPDFLMLGLHEYMETNWQTGRGYLLGRFVNWINAAETLGLRPPRICITEFGFDTIHGRGGPPFALHVGDLENYVYEQFRDAVKHIYAPEREDAPPLCAFCWGAVTEQWQPYDYNRMAHFKKRLVSEPIRLIPAPSAPAPPVQPPSVDSYRAFRLHTGLPGGRWNVRTEPKITARILFTLNAGDYIDVNMAQRAQAGGYVWFRARGRGQAGWIGFPAVLEPQDLS